MKKRNLVLVALAILGVAWFFYAAITQRVNCSEKSRDCGYLAKVIAPENLPNLLLCVVGISSLVVLWRQTNAAMASAEATKKNVDAFLASERPWVVVTAERDDEQNPSPGHPSCVNILARNSGKTPARIQGFKLS